MKFRFTAEHFETRLGRDVLTTHLNSQRAAEMANAALEAEEEKCERVYQLYRFEIKIGRLTTALLWNVEKIETEIAGIKIVADPKLKDGEAHFKSDYVYCNRCDGPCYCDRKWGSG